MKKTLALLLVSLMLLSLAACGSGGFSLGRFEGNEYHNDMLSLYFRLPASWHRADAAEAESLLGMKRTVYDTYDEEALAEVEKDHAFDLGYAFVLSTDGGLDRFDLLFQKNTGDGDSASYIASAREQLEKYGDLWEIRTVSNETVTIAGHEYVALDSPSSSANEKSAQRFSREPEEKSPHFRSRRRSSVRISMPRSSAAGRMVSMLRR